MVDVQQEAIARAALQETLPSGPGTSPAEQLAGKYRAKLTDEGPRPVLVDMMDHAKMEEQKKKAFEGADVAAGGRSMTPEQQARHDRYDAAQKDVVKYLEGGLNSLTPTEKARVMPQIENKLREWPAAAKYLDSIPAGPAREKAIEDILNNPAFKEKVQQRLDAVSNKDGADIATVDQTRQALDTAKRELALRDQVAKQKFGEYKQALADADRFDPTTGDLAKELRDLEKDETKLKADRDKKKAALDTVDQRLKIREKAYNATRLTHGATPNTTPEQAAIDELAALADEVKKLSGEAAAADAKIKRIDELRTQKRAAESGANAKHNELTEAENAKAEAQNKMLQASADVDLARRTKFADEESRAKAMENVLAGATVDFANDQQQKLETAQKEIREAEKQKAKDEAERRMMDHLSIRYNKVNRKGDVTLDTDTARLDKEIFDLRQSPEGAKLLVKDVLKRSGMTEAEANAKVNDPAELDKLAPKVMEQMLSKRIQSGGLSEKEASYFADTRYGKAALDQALSRNAEATKQIEEWQKQGVIKDKQDLLDKAKANGTLSKVLFLILGGLLVAGALPLAAAVGIPAVAGAVR